MAFFTSGLILLLCSSVISGATDIHVLNNCKAGINVLTRTATGDLVAAAPNSSPTPKGASSPAPAPAPGISKRSPPPAIVNEAPISKSRSIIPLIAAPTAAALLLAIATLVYLRYSKRLKLKEDSKFLHRSLLLPKQFNYRELAAATGNFDEKLKLGEGGFSTVFKATLSDGSLGAVKRMKDTRRHPDFGQFKAEVESLGNIHHLNLVKLKGFCVRGSKECMLVYEYMPNGSLDRWIFSRNVEPPSFLKWRRRMSIAVEVAQGLAYLHGGCSEQILHLDIKPQNILLDENFRARISDFGLAKLVDRDRSQVFTLHLRGTPGYMAPEWLQSVVTEKSDVFSYGVLLLQLVSSKPTLEVPDSSGSDIKLLPELASRMFQSKQLEVLVDPRLLHEDETLDMSEVERVVAVGLWCIQPEPSARPSMDTVVKMLQYVIDVPDPPVTSSATHQLQCLSSSSSLES